MGDCKDCKHFEAYEKFMVPFGECNRAVDISVGMPLNAPRSGFYSSDRDQCESYVVVGPNFGCKHFSVNESK